MESLEAKSMDSDQLEWSSNDCTIHKVVVLEGDCNADKPRPGASGEIITESLVIDSAKELLLSGSKYLNEENIPIEFLLGLPSTQLDRKIETALYNFFPGEESRVTLKVFLEPRLNQRQSSQTEVVEPLWVSLSLNIRLTSLVNASPIYSWFPETKVAKAREAYSLGSDLFKEGRVLDAFYLFHEAHKLAVFSIPLKKRKKNDEDIIEIVDGEKSTIEVESFLIKYNSLNNLAACHFQWKNYRSVVELSTIVLEAKNDPKSGDRRVKTLYRRGVSYLEMQEFDMAEKDLVIAHKLDSSNRAVNEQLGQVKRRRKASEALLSKRIGKMFN